MLYILTKFFGWDARLRAHLGGANAEIELRLSSGWSGCSGDVWRYLGRVKLICGVGCARSRELPTVR